MVSGRCYYCSSLASQFSISKKSAKRHFESISCFVFLPLRLSPLGLTIHWWFLPAWIGIALVTKCRFSGPLLPSRFIDEQPKVRKILPVLHIFILLSFRSAWTHGFLFYIVGYNPECHYALYLIFNRHLFCLYLFINFGPACVFLWAPMCHGTCVEDPWAEFRSSGLVASSFTHQAISPALGIASKAYSSCAL